MTIYEYNKPENADLRLSELREHPDSIVHRLLSDSDANVRHEAAFIISEMQEQGKAPGDALAALCIATHDRSVLVRHEVALAFGAFPRSRPAEIAIRLLCIDESEDVQSSAKLTTLKWQRRGV